MMAVTGTKNLSAGLRYNQEFNVLIITIYDKLGIKIKILGVRWAF